MKAEKLNRPQRPNVRGPEELHSAPPRAAAFDAPRGNRSRTAAPALGHRLQTKTDRHLATSEFGSVAVVKPSLNRPLQLARKHSGTSAIAAAFESKTGRHTPAITTLATRAIQRLHIGFTNVAKEQQTKADQIIRLLETHTSIAAFIGTRPCYITLVERDMPADISSDAKRVQINLAIWYFDKMSIGRIMGMLNHEFGIHPIASAGDTSDEDDMEDTVFMTGAEVTTGGGLFSKGKTELHTVKASAAKQADHIFGSLPAFNRYRAYQQVVIEMLTALNTVIQTKGSDVPVSELTVVLDTYLMDIASILAANDDRMQAAKSPNLVAALYNIHRANLQKALPKVFAGALPPEKGGVGVAMDYLKLGAQAKLKIGDSKSVRGNYQPGAEQVTYLDTHNLEIDWIAPTGYCVFDAIARVTGSTASQVKALTLLKLNHAHPATTAVVTNGGGTVLQAVNCITNNLWADPVVGDLIPEVAAVASGVGVNILMPGAWIYPINGGGQVIVKVVHPLEHYHATKAKAPVQADNS